MEQYKQIAEKIKEADIMKRNKTACIIQVRVK